MEKTMMYKKFRVEGRTCEVYLQYADHQYYVYCGNDVYYRGCNKTFAVQKFNEI